MTDVIRRYRRATTNQAVGVVAQLVFAAPALIASLAVARWSSLSLVADLALTFGATGTIMSAASFGLTPHLALWGLRTFTHEIFWLNRIVASCFGTIVALAFLAVCRADTHMVFLAVTVKFADSMADLILGLNLLRTSAELAMRRLLMWSTMRLAVFVAGIAVGRWLGFAAGGSLLVGGMAQFVSMIPWRTAARVMVTRDRINSAVTLGRSAAYMSASTTACGVLVTTPRLMARSLANGAELGHLGVVFVASTLIGMSFNVAWLRLATASRTTDQAQAVRGYLREGLLLGAALALGMWASIPIIERIYRINDGAFGMTFMAVGGSFVALYFVMSLANLLKTARIRLLEATGYLTSAAALAGVTALTRSLAIGLLAASLTLAVFVVFGVQSVRRLAT